MKPWLSYSLIRIGVFAAALTVLLLVGVPGWVAAIVAAVIGLTIAYIFFRPQRDEFIASVRKPPTADEDVEDAR